MRSGSTRRQVCRALILAGLCALVALPGTSFAGQAVEPGTYVPGEVVVRHEGEHGAQVVQVVEGDSVRETVTELRGDPTVDYAVPNFIARAAAFPSDAASGPNDPGFPLQWNFSGPFGINVQDAWSLAARRGAAGGRGAVVAVLDTGVAYRTRGRYR